MIMAYAFYGWEKADIRDENGLTPRDLYDLLRLCWSADTCAPRLRATWSDNNPTLGQCSITAFLAQDLLGGRVLGVPLPDGHFHCFNDVDGCVFDLTSEQFGGETLSYENCPEQSREAHFAAEEKRLRYEVLRCRLLGEYAVLLKHGGYNCCQAVLCAYCREAGLPAATLRRLGAGFGVGMGCMEATCGALIGAQMLLGLNKFVGRPLLGDAKRLYAAFEAACGAALCKDLKGVEAGFALCPCDDCVRRAILCLEQAKTGRSISA